MFPALFLTVATLAAPSSAAPVAGLGQPAHCRYNPGLHFARPGMPGQFRRLTDLPPAHAYYPMLERGADGCITPVLFGSRSGARVRPRSQRQIVPRSFP
jgi:hypothetical protein